MDNTIDFDEASKEWRKNKVHLGNGYFAYRCNYKHSNGRQCNKVVSRQKQQILYRIREDWIQKTNLESLEFCTKHSISGPKKIIGYFD
jgi:hypothetical protein